MRISCKDCDTKLKLKDSLAGKKIKCPTCESVIQLPALTQSAERPAKNRRVSKDPADKEAPVRKRRPKSATKTAPSAKAKPTRKSGSPKRRRKPAAEDFDEWDSDDGAEEQALPPRSRRKKKTAAKKTGGSQSAEGFRKTGTGLKILAATMVASLVIGLVSLIFPWGRTDWFLAVLLGGFNIASLIGSVLCIFVPKKTGAREFIYFIIACHVAGFVCGIVGRFAAIPSLAFVTMAIGLAIVVANLLFLRHLADYVKRYDLVGTVESLLKLWGMSFFVSPIVMFIPFVGPAVIGLIYIVGFFMMVTLLWQLGSHLIDEA